MHVGLKTKAGGQASTAEATAQLPLHHIPIAANDTVNTGAARLPARSVPLTASGFRTLLKWTDIVLACALSWYVLALSGQTLLASSVYQILPFALIPVVLSLGMRAASAYEFGLNKGVLGHLLSSANGAGWPLAVLGIATYWLYPPALSSCLCSP